MIPILKRKLSRTIAAATLIILTAQAAGISQAATIDPDRPTVLVTGANRGIGFAFAEYYVAAGWNVLAAVRTPEHATELSALANGYEHLVIEQLDVTDNKRIAELADRYRGTTIDVLINNAGVYGGLETQSWGSLDSETFKQVMAVNVFAPMKMAEAFADHVAASEQKKIVSITSGAGSVTREGRPGGGLIYEVSKAALNMSMRQIRAEVAEHGIIVALIAPGMVATDMRRRLRRVSPASPRSLPGSTRTTTADRGTTTVRSSLGESQIKKGPGKGPCP